MWWCVIVYDRDEWYDKIIRGEIEINVKTNKDIRTV